MTGRSAPLALAMGLLVLSLVVAIVLIPVLDERLRRYAVRKAGAAEAATSDNARAEAREAERRIG